MPKRTLLEALLQLGQDNPKTASKMYGYVALTQRISEKEEANLLQEIKKDKKEKIYKKNWRDKNRDIINKKAREYLKTERAKAVKLEYTKSEKFKKANKKRAKILYQKNKESIIKALEKNLETIIGEYNNKKITKRDLKNFHYVMKRRALISPATRNKGNIDYFLLLVKIAKQKKYKYINRWD